MHFKKNFSNDVVPSKGKANVTVQYKNNSINAELYVVPPNHASLIGRSWIRNLGLELKQIDEDMSLNIINSKSASNFNIHRIEDIINDFKEIFEEKVGCVPNFKISLALRANSKPIFTKAWNVPVLHVFTITLPPYLHSFYRTLY